MNCEGEEGFLDNFPIHPMNISPFILETANCESWVSRGIICRRHTMSCHDLSFKNNSDGFFMIFSE